MIETELWGPRELFLTAEEDGRGHASCSRVEFTYRLLGNFRKCQPGGQVGDGNSEQGKQQDPSDSTRKHSVF